MPNKQYFVRKAAACVGIVAAMTLGVSGSAQASAVHVTGGSGSHPHPYNFKVKKNHKNVVVSTRSYSYTLGSGDHLQITAQLYMTNTTTSHTFGDNSKTKLYVHYLYGCYASSDDVHELCQHVSFYAENHFGSQDKLGEYYSCSAGRNTSCNTTGWTKATSLSWNIHGGLYSSNYKFPKWQSLISSLTVEVNGYWLYLDEAAHSPWYQAVLNT